MPKRRSRYGSEKLDKIVRVRGHLRMRRNEEVKEWRKMLMAKRHGTVVAVTQPNFYNFIEANSKSVHGTLTAYFSWGIGGRVYIPK